MSRRWLQVIHLFDWSVTYTLLYQRLLKLNIDPGTNVQPPKGCLRGVCIHFLTLLLASPLSYSFQDHYFVHVHLYTSQNSCGTFIHPASAGGPGSWVVSKETMAAVIMNLALLHKLHIIVNSQFPYLWKYNFENFLSLRVWQTICAEVFSDQRQTMQLKIQGLERWWLSSYDILQKTQIKFPPPITGGSQLPITPLVSEVTALMCTTPMHTIKTKNKSLKLFFRYLICVLVEQQYRRMEKCIAILQ